MHGCCGDSGATKYSVALPIFEGFRGNKRNECFIFHDLLENK